MELTFTFIEVFAVAIYFIAPLLLFLFLFLTCIIALLGIVIGRTEGWSVLDSLYYAFITATTVGYGDFHPLKRRSKCIAILIALSGLLCTGIIVAVGLKAAEVSFVNHYDIGQIVNRIKLHLGK